MSDLVGGGEKPYKRKHCDKCEKYFITTTVLKMHKFNEFRGEVTFTNKIESFARNISKTNCSGESHVYSHRRQALQTQDCYRCGKYFITTTDDA